MNNHPLVKNSSESPGCPENNFLFPFRLFMGAQQQQQQQQVSVPADPIAQRAKWLYVSPVAHSS
jgi:hypothetical protein